MLEGKPSTVPWLAELVNTGDGLAARDLLARGGRAVPVSGAASAGDVVIVSSAVGRQGPTVRSILARAGTLKAELYRLVARHRLNPLYPGRVHAEAGELAASAAAEDGALEDLLDLPFVTIDNEDSRDLDQALHIERDERGYVVWYAIADASFFVRPGSTIFQEALARGSTYYLPSLALPMLPRLLCEDVISLNPERRRRALVFEMVLDEAGRCTDTKLHRARMRSRRKLSYARVQRAWDDPWGASFGGQPFAESLELLREVGRLCIAEAQRRHVVQHRRNEAQVVPTDAGPGFAVVARQRLEVERCNEQISLLCNVEGARLLEQGRGLAYVQPIFRVHPAPGPERLEEFQTMVEELVRAHRLAADEWTWRGAGEPLADYLGRLPRTARPRVAVAIDHQALLTNQRSVFAEAPARHHGVGAPVYARFSAPMREIVGIFTHKEAFELLGRGVAAPPTAEDETLRDQVVKAGNRARALQRQLTKEAHHLVLDRLFRQELAQPEEERPRRRGTLLGMKPRLLYVLLDEPPLEVKIHFSDLEKLTGVGWHPESHGAVARPSREADRRLLRAGDAVDLRLAGLLEKQRRWLFAIEPV